MRLALGSCGRALAVLTVGTALLATSVAIFVMV